MCAYVCGCRYINAFVFLFVCFQQWQGIQREREVLDAPRWVLTPCALSPPHSFLPPFISFLPHLCSFQNTRSCCHVSEAAPRACQLSSCQSNFLLFQRVGWNLSVSGRKVEKWEGMWTCMNICEDGEQESLPDLPGTAVSPSCRLWLMLLTSGFVCVSVSY